MSAPAKALPLLRPKEAAQLLGLATATLCKWRSRGVGPKWLRIGPMKTTRYAPEAIAEYLAAATRAPAE